MSIRTYWPSGFPSWRSATGGSSAWAVAGRYRRTRLCWIRGGGWPAFAAYSAYTRTPEFAAALDELLTAAAERRVSIMCSESVWWRCHRRVISDVAVLQQGVDVQHLMPDGRLSTHLVAEGARLHPDGQLYWDGLDAV
jgi:hypothetical protein